MTDRSVPEDEARPRDAFIGIVASAASFARAATATGAAPNASACEPGEQIEHGFLPRLRLAARFTQQ